MALSIVLWPDPVLLRGTQPITEVTPEVRQAVGEMRRVMFEEGGGGLAAPQVGLPLRMMLVCPSGRPGEEEVVLNPEIVDREGREVGEEGCLSFPGLFGKVERDIAIRVRYQDLELRTHEMELEGFVARVFQHEHDHLEGIVFTERMQPASLEKIRKGLDRQKATFEAAQASEA